MSIFTKVLILFLLSLTLMIFVSNETNKLTQNTIETLLIEKYIQISGELFNYLANNDHDSLQKKIEELDLEVVEDKKHYLDVSKTIYNYETPLSAIKIMKYSDNKYLLYMNYLDDDVLIKNLIQDKNLQEEDFLSYLILADILILVILFFIILKMIYPLQHMSQSIKKFGEGNYSSRIEIASNDEIGKLATTFNAMASNIEELIISRQRLLRDIGHEIKTPITKSKLAIEMIEESKYKKLLKKALEQMDDMTNELLYIEKLNANQYSLKLVSFNVETLLSEALSKLLIEDETLINISVKSNFEIKADLNYLSIAVKNIIDNALKYSLEKPILIEVEDNEILIKSKGEKLEKSLDFYCEAFSQGDDSREQKGYGLGLNLVKQILDKHHYELSYFYENEYNVFVIQLSSK